VGGQLLHDIKRELQAAHPGRERADQEAKARLLDVGFGTRQWAKVEGLPRETLLAGLEKIRAELKQTALAQSAPAELPATPDDDPIGPMTDGEEIHKVMDQWTPAISREQRAKIFRGMFGTDDLEKVDFAAASDAIELFKKVAAKEPAAVAEVNKYLRAA
jgi:hypothetical protein